RSVARNHEPASRDQCGRHDRARRHARSRIDSPGRAPHHHARSGAHRRSHRMRAIDYALREAWRSLWRTGRSTVFAILAITLAALVLGALLTVTWNVDQLLARWSAASEFSVFLRDDATSEQRGAIEAAIDQSG